MTRTPTQQGAAGPLFWRAAPFVFLVFWSGGYSFAKLALIHIEPLTKLTLRYGLVMLALLPRSDAARISALFYFVPPLAMIIAWAVPGETVAPAIVAGFAFSALGIYIVGRQAKG